MPLIYVTGLSGSGKSAVLRELRARGLEAYRVDEDGYTDWVRRDGGAIEHYPARERGPVTRAWRRDHHWVLSADRIGELQRNCDQAGRTVFLCGVAAGDGDVWHCFDTVVALVADIGTLCRRIANRRDNDFGKSPGEREQILNWRAGYEETYRRFGAMIVDATKPIKTIVDRMLTANHPDNTVAFLTVFRNTRQHGQRQN
jgi:thymidylate kinase